MVIVTLLFDKWIGNPNSFYAFFSLSAWSWGYPLIARLSEITALILLFTSNNFSQKKLKKNWKRIQRSSYIYVITGGILALRYWDAYGVKISMLLVILLFLSVFVYKEYKKLR
jgi:DMSO/TMAO reductase YedYZ heme-binding membrane subunit